MYEHLAKRPAQEKKDSRPSPPTRDLNAANKNGDKRFSHGNVRIQYDPRKTARLKAHAFTQSSAGLKKSTPSGVIRRAVRIYHANRGQWEKISGMDEEGTFPFPENPVEGMVFDDRTNEIFSPHTSRYKDRFTQLLRRRHRRAIAGIYNNANRLCAFTKDPTRRKTVTPFYPRESIAQVYPITRRGKTSCLASTKGMGKRNGNRRGSITYDDVGGRKYPAGVLFQMREDLPAAPGALTQGYAEELIDEQRGRLAGPEAIQYVGERRVPTGVTLPAVFSGFAEGHTYNEAKALYPLAHRGGTQETRDVLSGKKILLRNKPIIFLHMSRLLPRLPPCRRNMMTETSLSIGLRTSSEI